VKGIKCTKCGFEKDPVSKLCAYCETEEVRALGREHRKEVQEKLAREEKNLQLFYKPPTLDELASASLVCERLAVHIDKTSGDARALILRRAAKIFKIAIDFSIVLFVLTGCAGTKPTDFEDPDASVSEPEQSGFFRFNTRSISDASEESPDASEESPDASEESPDASEESPDASEESPDASEESPDASEESLDASEESLDASGAAEESPDAAEESPDASEESPDAGDCNPTGRWRVYINPQMICFRLTRPEGFFIDVSSALCTQDVSVELDIVDPDALYGHFVGTIVYHLSFVGETMTANADIEGTITTNAGSMACDTTAFITGVKQ
jgi:hypothetical protein